MLNIFQTKELDCYNYLHGSVVLEALNVVKSKLPYPYPVFVGGGVLRDFVTAINDSKSKLLSPKDIDIFIGGTVEAKHFGDFEQISPDHLHPSEPFLIAQFYIPGITIPIQVMCMPKVKTMPALLDHFDWNTSLYVTDGKRLLTRHDRKVQKLVLQGTKNPISTLRRGYRFSERFRMPIDMQSLLFLTKMITDRHYHEYFGPDDRF